MAATTRKAIRRWSAETGTAAIEFGLAAPLLLVMLMGVAEVGYTMYQAMQVYDSVEAGALYAVKNGYDVNGITSAVEKAIMDPQLKITASPAPVPFCGCPSVTGIANTVCSSTCSDGGTPGQYVRISASLTRGTILPYPVFGLPTTLTAQSVVRLN